MRTCLGYLLNISNFPLSAKETMTCESNKLGSQRAISGIKYINVGKTFRMMLGKEVVFKSPCILIIRTGVGGGSAGYGAGWMNSKAILSQWPRRAHPSGGMWSHVDTGKLKK